jgi:amidase
MTSDDLCWMPARRLAAGIAAKTFSAVEVLDAHLARIAEVNPDVNAIVTLDQTGAQAAARASDNAIARGETIGPLHGLPIAVKDLEDTAGMRTTYGSPIFADQVPERDSLLVERLRRAGAIVIGKTNTPEFGAGSQTFNEVFGVTRNPYDLALTPGGSSGGAAVAVATGMVPVADGSDLASSVRNPAAFCNVVGLRPSPGRIPSAGVGSDPWEPLSVLGPIARSVDDAGLLLGALAGEDPRDPLSVAAPADALAPITPADPRGLKIAWSADLGDLPIEPAIAEVLFAARERLSEAGCEITPAEPDLRRADEGFEIMRAVGFAQFGTPLLAAYPDLLKDTVIWNIRRGQAMTGADVGRARVLHEQIFRAMREFLLEFDVLAAPVTQVAPFPVDLDWPRTIDGHEMENYIAWLRSCSRITFTGHPAVSVPAGFTRGGLPVGLQLVGRFRDEWTLLRAAAVVADALAAVGRRPPAAAGQRSTK